MEDGSAVMFMLSISSTILVARIPRIFWPKSFKLRFLGEAIKGSIISSII